MNLRTLAISSLVACSPGPSPTPDAAAGDSLVGHWHQVADPTKLLQFSADGTYYDTAFDEWTADGYQCTGKYTLDGYVVTLEETCPKVDADHPCLYTKDVLAAAVAGTSLSVTSFHRDDGTSTIVGDWRHHTERWRQLLNADGACTPTVMEEADDLTLSLAAGGAFTYALASKQWNTDTQQYDTSQSSQAGTYHVAGTQVILDNAPVAPMQLLGSGLATGEDLYSHD